VNQNKLELLLDLPKSNEGPRGSKTPSRCTNKQSGEERERGEGRWRERGEQAVRLGPRCCCLLRFFRSCTLLFHSSDSKCPRMFRRSPAKVKKQSSNVCVFFSHGPAFFLPSPSWVCHWVGLRCAAFYLFSLKSASSGFFSSPCACWLPCADPLL
jgi:hypothetical protein